MFVGTWWSLMPPIVAIALALLTKEVYLSLFAGCALGALLVAEFHPWIAFDTLFNTMIDVIVIGRWCPNQTLSGYAEKWSKVHTEFRQSKT